MSLVLRKYQREAIDSIYEYWDKSVNPGNILLSLPTGSGKSLVMATFMQEVLAAWPDTRLLMLTHVKELIRQNELELLNIWPSAPVGVYSAGLGRREAPDMFQKITIAGIQSVYNKSTELGRFDLILVDECFTGETMITTPTGLKRIDSMAAGDTICHALGEGVVEAVSTKIPQNLINLEFDNGTTITCTPNHPFFTARGWIKAASMEFGEGVFSEEALCSLRENIYPFCLNTPRRNTQKRHEGAALEQARVLLSILCKEAQQSYEQVCYTSKSKGHVEADKTCAHQTRGEWSATSFTSTSAVACTGGRLAGGICCSNGQAETARRTDLLQNRHCQCNIEDGNRNTRVFSHITETSKPGCAETSFHGIIRLAGIKPSQRGSNEPVFNLQVSGHPSYFANGILVHNCHLIPAKGEGMYRTFLSAQEVLNPHVKVIGFTATPYRLGTGLLTEGKTRIFEDICYEKNVGALVKEGYLAPLVSKGGVAKADLSEVKVRGGEYVPDQLAAACDKVELIKAAIDEVMWYCEDRKSWLLFCASMEHAGHVRDELLSRGVTAAMVHGGTPDAERDRILSEFKAGEIRALTNVGVLTTGFNHPALDALIMLRPTKSTSLYVQMLGRGMRKAPEKSDCLVLDFAGNTMEHGPIDKIVVTRCDRTGKAEVTKAPAKECPECMSIIHAAKRKCDDCGYEFPERELKHDTRASDMNVMGTTQKYLAVDCVEYKVHRKEGSPPSVKVTYVCGLSFYSEWVCIEHRGYAQEKAWNWWTSRVDAFMPTTTEEAVKRLNDNPPAVPSRIKVKLGEKFPSIIRIIFDDINRGTTGVENHAQAHG